MDGWVIRSTELVLTVQRGIMVEFDDVIWAVVYTTLAMITRFWRIGAANYVVWDEVCDTIISFDES